MNELVRMQYLDAMGIDSFVPRMVLPSAPLSVECELPVSSFDHVGAAQSLDVAGDEAPQVAAPSPETTAIVQQILSAGSEPSVTPSAKPAVPPSLTLQELLAAKPKQQLRFVLSIWQLDNGVVFVDTKEPKAALPTSALLKNIVRGLYPEQELPKPDSIHWPLLENAVTDDNALSDAREMVQAFLASRFEVKAPGLLVVMGRAASDVIMATSGEDLAALSYGQSLSLAHLGCAAVYLPSLAELLRDPALKHYIWPAIKATT